MLERDGQKAIVIGKQGSMLKKIGTAARTEIEAFMLYFFSTALIAGANFALSACDTYAILCAFVCLPIYTV